MALSGGGRVSRQRGGPAYSKAPLPGGTGVAAPSRGPHLGEGSWSPCPAFSICVSFAASSGMPARQGPWEGKDKNFWGRGCWRPRPSTPGVGFPDPSVLLPGRVGDPRRACPAPQSAAVRSRERALPRPGARPSAWGLPLRGPGREAGGGRISGCASWVLLRRGETQATPLRGQDQGACVCLQPSGGAGGPAPQVLAVVLPLGLARRGNGERAHTSGSSNDAELGRERGDLARSKGPSSVSADGHRMSFRPPAPPFPLLQCLLAPPISRGRAGGMRVEEGPAAAHHGKAGARRDCWTRWPVAT